MIELATLPPEAAPIVQGADLVLVPCRENRNALKQAGVHRPIRVVPLGLDPVHLAQLVPERPPRPIRFLWVGASSHRKGHDLLAPAFRALVAALGTDRDVELIVKTTANDGRAFRTRLGTVTVICEDWSVEDLAALYRTAHVFLFPTRGEGWGLTALESMAAGCLVLAPRIGGLAEFLVGWELPWVRRPIRYGIETWAPEVPMRVLAAAMLRAVREYPATADLRARARREAERFTWAASAAAVLHAIETTAAVAA